MSLVVTNCDSLTGWSVWEGALLTLNETDQVEGSGCISINSDPLVIPSELNAVLIIDQDWSPYDTLRIRVRSRGGVAFVLLIYTPSSTNAYSISLGAERLPQTGVWYELEIPFSEFDVYTGVPDPASVHNGRFRYWTGGTEVGFDVDLIEVFASGVSPPPPVFYQGIITSTPVEGIPITLRGDIEEMSEYTNWNGDLEEGRWEFDVPSVVEIDGKTYVFRQWENSFITTDPTRVHDVTADFALNAAYDLVEDPPPIPPVSIIPPFVGATVGTGLGYIFGKNAGSIAGAVIGAAAGYVASKALPVYVASCSRCGEKFEFTTYGVPVWCPTCGAEQIVKKEGVQ